MHITFILQHSEKEPIHNSWLKLHCIHSFATITAIYYRENTIISNRHTALTGTNAIYESHDQIERKSQSDHGLELSLLIVPGGVVGRVCCLHTAQHH